MSDETQGKATQRSMAGGSNAKAMDKGEAAAAARDDAAVTRARASAPARAAEEDTRPTAAEIAKREPKMFRATERGYVDGRIVEAGETFVTRADPGLWMEPTKGGNDYGVQAAVDEAQYGKKADVDYEGMSEPALQALAALVGVTKPGELGKDDLIAAIKAARIPVAQ